MDTTRFEVFYDGDCPLCLKEIRMLSGWTGAGRILFTDIAPDFSAEEATGRTHEQLMAEIYGRLPSGESSPAWRCSGSSMARSDSASCLRPAAGRCSRRSSTGPTCSSPGTASASPVAARPRRPGHLLRPLHLTRRLGGAHILGFDQPIQAIVIGGSGSVGGAFVSALLAHPGGRVWASRGPRRARPRV